MIDEAKFESLIRKKQKRVLDCSSLSEYHCEDFSSAAREALEDSSDPFALRWYWDTVAKLPLWYRVGFLLLSSEDAKDCFYSSSILIFWLFLPCSMLLKNS